MQNDLVQRLISLLEPEINTLGYDMLELELLSGKPATLRIYIDQEKGILVEDCAAVSRHIGVILEVEDPIPGEYTLEVSSPGTERPLRLLEHFASYTGEQAKLKLSSLHEGRKRLKGILQGVSEDKVLIKVDDKEYAVPFALIDKAHLAPEYSFK
ncbi:MAG: ribosome maturation factor RimP [Gammaproteobacteria bacterium]|nr:ribosome maturation factor RimP [Gammaproteobacteria bacterium]NNC97029.1 ribosome maturation factor RimP [Gammaproteobacteria bacterium]NNM13865.1 ribosome maturation factor RimP [Gammaproteobacteria bacterium]